MAPIQSYFGKAQVFKRYKEAYNTGFYKALTKELPVLVKLYDYIEQDLANKYNEYKKSLGFLIHIAYPVCQQDRQLSLRAK